MLWRMGRCLPYLWALPTTTVGLLVAGLTVLTGGRATVHTGVLEASGGFAAFFLRRCTLLKTGAQAMTLGHVVVARTPELLEHTRGHERVHVRQCERWGPLFLPAYGIASIWIFLRGGNAYRDNPFEQEAYGHDARAAREITDQTSPENPMHGCEKSSGDKCDRAANNQT